LNIREYSVGSILLETLISILILGLIATGSFYSYGFVYQRIHSQRQQRFALSMLQGWMEDTISSLLDPDELLELTKLKDQKNDNAIKKYLREKERDFREKFKAEISTLIDPNDNINPEIAFIDPDISIECIDNGDYDMIEIRITATLLNNKDIGSSKKGQPITLYTNTYLENIAEEPEG
jgi:hypothetical protein